MKKSTSAAGFLRRTALAASITGSIATLAVAQKWGWTAGLALLAGLAWGLANFVVLAWILRDITNPGPTRKGLLAALVAVKLLGLYPVAIWALVQGALPPLAMVAGFTWILLVIGLRALGEMWWDRTQGASGTPGDSKLTETTGIT